MLPKINPSSTTAWQKLQAHYTQMQTMHLKELFAADPQRFQQFSITEGDVLFDCGQGLWTLDLDHCGIGAGISK